MCGKTSGGMAVGKQESSDFTAALLRRRVRPANYPFRYIGPGVTSATGLFPGSAQAWDTILLYVYTTFEWN